MWIVDSGLWIVIRLHIHRICTIDYLIAPAVAVLGHIHCIALHELMHIDAVVLHHRIADDCAAIAYCWIVRRSG